MWNTRPGPRIDWADQKHDFCLQETGREGVEHSEHPHVLQWFRDKSTVLFCDFLERWPSLEAAQAARRDVLERFFHSHNVRGRFRIDARIDAIKSAMPLTDDSVSSRPEPRGLRYLLQLPGRS